MPRAALLAFGGMNRVLPPSALRFQSDGPTPARILQDCRPDKLPALEPRKSARHIIEDASPEAVFPRAKV